MVENTADFDIERDFRGCVPEMPDVFAKFIDLARELSVTKRSYANYLLLDPTLSTRIFSYINLVLNPSGMGYISINKGISLMGLQKFKNLVMVFSLYPIYEEMQCIDLFKHSLESAYIAKGIAAQYNFINPHDAFLLGFLHDIGKIAFKTKFGDKYAIFRNDGGVTRESTIEEEVTEFKYCHADISEYTAKKWNLPLVIVDAIKYHHFPLSAMLPQAASIIYLAGIISKKDFKLQPQLQKVLHYMQLTKADLAQFMGQTARFTMPFYEILGIHDYNRR